MDMQNVAKLDVPEGDVRTVHDKYGNLIWGKVSYDVKYKGDTTQNGIPTPSTPVAVQTVTGEQTFSINGAAHTVDLGSIELCKIGAYQDYIYKSGSKWYVHKEVGKTLFSNLTWDGPFDGYHYIASFTPAADGNYTDALCTHFKNKKAYPTADGDFAIRTDGDSISCYSSSNTTLAAWNVWVSTNNPIIYYPLATPTNTEITNEALVGQLENIEQWLTRYGYNATVFGNLPIIIDRTAL